MKNVLKKLNHIKATPGSNDKIELLKIYLENVWFRKTVKYALNENKHFNIKKLPPSDTTITKVFSPKERKKEIFKFLLQISKKLGATDFEKQDLANLCQSVYSREVVGKILTKSLRSGFSAKLVNKARPGTIKRTPYQRCSTKKKLSKITYPAIAQIKMNGMFCNAILENDKINFLSRTGSKFKFATRSLKKNIRRVFPLGNIPVVLMGEFLIYKDKSMTEIMDRQTGNGIINKALKGTITKEESNRVFLVIWDMVIYKDWKEESSKEIYMDRFHAVLHHLTKRNSYYTSHRALRVKPVSFRFVETEREALDWAGNLINSGEEGIVIKNFKAKWKNNTSGDQIKIKSEKVCELQIIGWQYGAKEGKFENCLGAFKCASSDKGIIVDISGGLSERFKGIKEIDKDGNVIVDEKRVGELDSYIGKIVGVTFESVIDSKVKEDPKSLYLPRFEYPDDNCIRIDKDSPDSTKYIEGV